MITKAALRSVIAFIFCWSTVSSGQIPIQLTAPLPSRVDNSQRQFFPPIIDQLGESCGNANGIGYTFTYETDALRNLPASAAQNQYPYWYTYAFLNDGSDTVGTSHMYVDALQIAQENGIPAVADCGTFTASSPTRWLSGYDAYYSAMRNRVDIIDSIDMLDASGFAKLKQWLYDHGDKSPSGGIANFGCNVDGWQSVPIVSGPETGKTIMVKYGPSGGDHGQTIVGYDDSVRYDFNGDGKFTNTLDIDHDGKITMADWEIGALKVANSWGTDYFDAGLYYLPYRILAIPVTQGGIKNGNRVCIMTAKANYAPRMALKAMLTHSQRNSIALSVGVARDALATTPAHVRVFSKQFTYAGGPLPMCGKGGSPTIEIGLDVSDLLDSIPGAQQATFFLIVDAKGTAGTVNSLSLMDYTSGTAVETKSPQTTVPITTGKTYLWVTTLLKAGVLPGKSRAIAGDGVQVRRIDGKVEVRAPFDAKQPVALFDVQGRQRAAITSRATGQWLRFPEALPAGVLFRERPLEGRQTADSESGDRAVTCRIPSCLPVARPMP